MADDAVRRPEQAARTDLKPAGHKLPHRPAAPVPPARPLPELPFLSPPDRPAVLFDPERHCHGVTEGHGGASGALPLLPLAAAARAHPELALIPREEDCLALWDRYEMLDNIRAHSRMVAGMAYAIALLAENKGLPVQPEAVLAAGLLHDLAKTYTIAYGGNHAQLGASWVMRETRNGPIAQAVMHHVHWPWDENADDPRQFLPLAIAYADKRVMHDDYVGLDERFADLLVRYGVNDYAKERITLSHQQGKRLEAALSRRLGVNLDECIADNGRLVERT